MNVRSARLALVPWFVLFAACSGDRVSENLGRVEEALTSNDRILGFEGTISGAAGSDWRPVVGTATSSTTHSDGSHSMALGGNQNPSAISAALTALGTLSGAPSVDVMFQTGYQPQGAYFGQAGLYFTCGTTINNQFLGSIQLHGPTGSFNHYTFASLPQNVATALSTTNGCTVKVELNLSNTGSVPVLVDKLSFGQATGSGGTGGSGGSAGTSGAAGSSGSAGKAGSGSGASGKAGAAGTSGGGSGGSSDVGGSGGAGAGGKSGGGGTSGAGPGGMSGSGGAGAGAGGISGGGAGGARGGAGGARGGAAGAGASGAGAGGAGAGGASGGTGVEFYIDLPVHVPRTSVALGTTGGALVLNDYVRILASPSGFSSISSVKTTTETNLGVSAETLNLWSEANVVVLRDGAYVHGNLATEGGVNTQNNVHVTGTETVNGTLTPIQHQSWIVQFPSTNGGPVNLDVSQVRTIPPGAYGGSTLQRNARLTLSGSGRYTLDGPFDLEPSSTLDVDNTQGPIQIYASGGFTFRGTLSPRDPTKNNIFIGIGGTGAIPIDTSFNAILVAPHGDVTLGSANHSGAIYARSINVGAHVDFTHRPFAPSDLCSTGATCDGLCQCSPGGGCTDDGSCATDVHCSQNECGGPSGGCTTSSQCAAGLMCSNGSCVPACSPSCDRKGCGSSDGCGSTCPCGTKNPGDACYNADDCKGALDCGSCGNGPTRCGLCSPGQECVNGSCQCAPNCEGKTSGDSDGCGGKCLTDLGATGCSFDSDCLDDGPAPAEGAPPTRICVQHTCMRPDCLSYPQLLGCGTSTSICGPACTPHPVCTRDADCGAGYYCPANNGWRFGEPGKRVCQRPACDSSPKATGCGDMFSECGLCYCTPQCGNKHCGDADLSDGCGGMCTNLCSLGEGGCSRDSDCVAGGVCRAGVCRPLQPCGNVNVQPPDCGSGSATCGPCLTPPPASTNRQCGVDPNTQVNVGSCAPGERCTAEGQCTPAPQTPPIQVSTSGTVHAIIPPASPPAVPGVGAIPGRFEVSDRGSATYTIPIDVPPGRAITPALAIRYASSSGNGALGVGWSLDGLSEITRCQPTFAQDGFSAPITGTDADQLCLDGQRLKLVNDPTRGPVYYTMVDTFNQVRPGFTAGNGNHVIPDYFKVYAKDGRILTYDQSGTSALANGQVGTWSLTRVDDRAGNFMKIDYVNYRPSDANGVISSAEILPNTITYGGRQGSIDGDRVIQFHYDTNRVDTMLGWRAPAATLFTRTRRLKSIDLSAEAGVVRSYQLSYDEARGVSRLTSIQECASSVSLCKPPTTFSYFDETGFENAVPVSVDCADTSEGCQGTLPDIINGINPYGYALQNGSGKDRLSTATIVTTVDTGLVSFFDSVGIGFSVLSLGGGAAIAAAGSIAAQAASTAAGSNAANNQFIPVDLELYTPSQATPGLLHMRYDLLPKENCFAPQRQPVLDAPLDRDPGEYLVDDCPRAVPTGQWVEVNIGNDSDGNPVIDQERQYADYFPRVWYLDVDGDGLQDELQCGSNRNQQSDTSSISVVYATKTGSSVHIPGPHEPNVDLWVPAFSDMCAAVCNNQEQRCTAITPFSTMLDVNGDGTPDLVAADAEEHLAALIFTRDPQSGSVTGTWHPEYFSGVTLAVNSRDYIVAMDANGDGLRDLVGLPSDQIDATRTARIAYNTGAGFVERPLASASDDAALAPQLSPYVLDYDHDGFDDLLEPVSTAEGQWRIRHFKNGVITVESSPINLAPGTMGDFDGDGNMDLLTASKNDAPGSWHLSKGRGRRDHLLKSVTDGMGRYVSISYDGNPNLGDPSNQNDPAWDLGLYNAKSSWSPGWPLRVVKQGKTDHALVTEHSEGHWTRQTHVNPFFQTDRVVDYGYSDWANDVAGYGPLGFSSRLVVERDSEGLERGRRLIEYNLTQPASTAAPYLRLFSGLPAKITELGGAVAETTTTFGYSPRTETTFDWDQTTSYGGRPFPYLRQRTADWGLNARGRDDQGRSYSALQKLSERVEATTVDEFNNVTHSEVSGIDVPPTSIDKDFTPSNDELESWLISLPKNDDTTSTAADCTAGCDALTRHRHNDYTYYPGTNLLQTVHRADGGSVLDKNVDRTTTLGRDPAGNVDQIVTTDLLGNRREVDIGFDDRYLFPVTITRVGQTQTDQTTQVRYDDRFGTLVARVDPNGIEETWSYDDFGILRLQHGPSGDASTDYATDDFYSIPQPQEGVFANFKVTATKSGGETQVSEYNNLGQLVRHQVTGLGGQQVFEERDYDWRNRLSRIFRPHLDSDTTQGAEYYLYDLADRVVERIRADDKSTQYFYGVQGVTKPDYTQMIGITSTRTVDANGRVQTRTLDADGHVRVGYDSEGPDPDQPDVPAPTFYGYGAFGLLDDIWTSENLPDELLLTLDDYGRVVGRSQPYRGLMTATTTYDGLDEPIHTADNAARERDVFYDDFGRIDHALDQDGETQWVYDTDFQGGGHDTIGRLVQTKSPSGQIVDYGYTGPESGRNRGLLSRITEHLHAPPQAGNSGESVDLSVDYTYDSFSRLTRIDYPAVSGPRFAVEYGFDIAGHVISAAQPADLRGPNDPALIYWQFLQADEGLRVQKEQLGNTACASAGVVTVRQFDHHTGQLDDVQSACGDTLLQHLSYDYNDAHSMIGRTDHVTNHSESFGYDSAGRLDRIDGAVALNYSVANHGISYQAGVGAYGTQVAGPDQEQNDYWTQDAGGNSYTRDAAGNQTGRSGPGVVDEDQQITYTTFDLPSEIIKGNGYVADFSYAGAGTRAVKSATYAGSPAGITFYMGDLFQRVDPPSGPRTARNMIYAGGRLVAIATATDADPTHPTLHYLHDDALGSIQTVSAADGTLEATRDFSAFGVDRGNNAHFGDIPYGFTGQEHDSDFGLINMHGRIYDPVLAQFLSSDPYMPSVVGHGLNAFAYVNNQPLEFVDPSGFTPGSAVSDLGDISVNGATSSGAAFEGYRAGASGAGDWGSFSPGLPEGTMGTGASAASFGEGSISAAEGVLGVAGIAIQIAEIATRAPNPHKSQGVPGPRGPRSSGSTVSKNVSSATNPARLDQGHTTWQAGNSAPPVPNDCALYPGSCLAQLVPPAEADGEVDEEADFAEGGPALREENLPPPPPPLPPLPAEGEAVVGPEGYPTCREPPPFRQGLFSITDWANYPDNVPRPKGPVGILSQEEYTASRSLANDATARIRAESSAQGTDLGPDLHIHHITPIQFGGSPTDLENMTILPQPAHAAIHQQFWIPLANWAQGE